MEDPHEDSVPTAVAKLRFVFVLQTAPFCPVTQTVKRGGVALVKSKQTSTAVVMKSYRFVPAGVAVVVFPLLVRFFVAEGP